MSDRDLPHIKDMIARMSPRERRELDQLLANEFNALWLPDVNNIPQQIAYESKADLLLYGGAAGGGKTDLLIGTALTRHQRSVVFRAQYKDLRGIEDRLLSIVNNGSRDGYNGQDMIFRRGDLMVEMGALGKPGQEFDWQGRAHDFIGVDEAAQLPGRVVRFVMTWLRSSVPGQRTRAILASNPPMGGEGDWLIEWFAPWLDPMFDKPAKPGELRWAVVDGDGKTIWVDGPQPYQLGTETVEPMSRTFIPARVSDNSYLPPEYKRQLQALEEPLRSKLLHGDFLAGRSDHEWQVIPSAWVRAAQTRWVPTPPPGLSMLTMGVDVGGAGAEGDPHVIAMLHGNWFAPLEVVRGVDSKDGPMLAGRIMALRRGNALICIDMTGGYGNSAFDHLRLNHLPCESAVFSVSSGERTMNDMYRLKNLRAEMYWRFREALDPASSENIALPPDERLFAELTAVRWKPRGDEIVVEDKGNIRARLGTSTDRADAVIMAWHFRRRAMLQQRGRTQEELYAVEVEDPLGMF